MCAFVTDGFTREPSGGVEMGDYLKVRQDIMATIAGADPPHDTSFTHGEYVGLLLNKSSNTTGSFVAATTTYEVPALKRCLIVEFKGSDGTVLDTANQKIRFYNVTSSAAVLPESYFASSAQQLSGREIASAAGKTFRLESYHGDTNVTPLGWIILRIIAA